MKSPSNYGSENEETNFIRRVAAPDRPNSKRRQKKRLAIAGAAMLLVGAAAGVGFATLQSTQSNTMATQQMAANLVVPDFVETMGDPYFPSFDELDENGDGVVAYGEYMKDLNEVWDQDRENIKRSDLPDVVKQDLNNQLDDKIASDSACVKKAMVPTKKRTLSFDRKTINSLYYMLEVYCFETPIEIPQKYMDMFPETKAPVPPAPVIPEIPAPPAATEAATSAPIEVSTPGGGQQTITLVGPAVDSQQKVEIETGGGVVTTTVQVEQTASGGEKLDIPTPGGQTTTVIVPENNIPTTENGSGFKNEQQTVNVETPQGPATVTVESPVIDGKQEVTITTTDGTTTTATADVTPTENGDNELEIPGPDGTTTTVTIPSTPTEGGQGGEGGYPSEQQSVTEALPSVQVDTPEGFWTVFFDGPVNDGLQRVKLQKHDGSISVLTLFVNYRADDKMTVEIPTGPGDQTTTVFVPELSASSGQGSVPADHQQVSVTTPSGLVKVTTDSAVVDGKQQVTITTSDGRTITTAVEVTPTSDGKNALEIPTGPEGQSMIVTIPQPPSAGSTGGSGAVPQSSNAAPAPEVVVDTPQGPATVTITGPVVDDKQVVAITTPDGETTTTTVDVTKTRDGKTELEIPTGPEGSTTTVSVPSTPTQGSGGQTTTDILNQLGGNDIDNGDKDFMSKDEFQLQIGSHFSEKIMALKQQTKDEETESDKLLDQQKQLQDCILQAANKFGYFGVYEQPPYFKNAVHWVDNDCLKQ
ncbi:hypothetical protein PC113_g2914 [Phytophthora cactorum]|uniref:EF-hand domain-containing protein n=1 Tax=Phytophthora cactorum TaxID=29920 RepID=A0A8T0ZV62_9STRA|nr:hypothetical protein PC112_g11831 [Phytophthora cactorum]KAG2833355.1 hypothetical protein PC111_g6252 [Phytophthora cactorum]KAG2866369.1 hypothetical protein PC113_g2914 [Phytophthora cactorum]KAG2928714.1 hypothetical protein PC114_g3017 [Phytophthora cactorum]KAG3101938.1 hypothetical protein PC122_g2468 [Phytophthora cactorum]